MSRCSCVGKPRGAIPRDASSHVRVLHVTPVALSYDSSMTWWTVDVAQWYDTSRLYRMYCKPEWSGKLLTFSMVWTVLPPTTSVDPSKESGLPDTEVTYLTDSSWSDYTCFWSFTSRAKRSCTQVKTAWTDMSLFSLRNQAQLFLNIKDMIISFDFCKSAHIISI